MIDQLRKIAESIDQLLAEDEFPFSIRPDYLAEAVRAYPVRGGKRLRPALLIWSCGLLGGDEAKALYPAAAVEVYHNWTLVHDDIIDRDDTRRGMPTAHVQLATELQKRFQLSGTGGPRRRGFCDSCRRPSAGLGKRSASALDGTRGPRGGGGGVVAQPPEARQS